MHPLLLLHAGVADRRMWNPIRPRLERARRVLSPDGLGYGERPLPKAEFSRVDDVITLLDTSNVERAAVVGASDGGRVAIDLALEHPDRVAALVLAAPALGGWNWSQQVREFGGAEDELLEAGKDRGGGRAQRPDVGRRPRPRAGRGRRRDPRPRPRDADARLRAPARLRTRTSRTRRSTGRTWPRSTGWESWQAPTLVLVGELDLPDFPAIAERIAAEAPRARVISLDGVAHLPSLEKPELFAELVLAFLDELGV